METSALRALVKAAAIGTPHARLWPNGLGFDCRGTSYWYNERLSHWEAVRRIDRSDQYVTKHGTGTTPYEAKRAAGIGGRSVNSRGGKP